MALDISGISASESKSGSLEWVAMAIGVVILIGAPFVVYPVFLMELLCMALFACAFNLLIGGGGLLSFGHAAFFGGGAYIAAETAKMYGFSFELAILAGTATAVFLGLIAGLIAIRRSGLIFAMVTLALAQAVYFLALRLPFTHSEDGIQAVPRGWLFGIVDLRDNMAMYYVCAGIFFLGYLLVRRVWKSPFGQVLRAVKDNQPRMISLGFPVDRYKLINFVLSAGTRRRRRLVEGDRARPCDPHRRRFLHLGRGGADGVVGRARHADGTGGRRYHHRVDGRISRRHRYPGAGGHRRDFRLHHSDFPPRHRRRVPLLPQPLANSRQPVTAAHPSCVLRDGAFSASSA